jgi:hypothetical protein
MNERRIDTIQHLAQSRPKLNEYYHVFSSHGESRPPLRPRSWVGDRSRLPRRPKIVNEEAVALTTTSLWGKPEHLKYLSTSLRDRFPEDQLHILVAKRNAGSFTYDGVDTGGERVAEEVERKLEELSDSGHDIQKISVIGYSLGGLIARYAIGLLFHRGVFEKIQPVVCVLSLS